MAAITSSDSGSLVIDTITAGGKPRGTQRSAGVGRSSRDPGGRRRGRITSRQPTAQGQEPTGRAASWLTGLWTAARFGARHGRFADSGGLAGGDRSTLTGSNRALDGNRLRRQGQFFAGCRVRGALKYGLAVDRSEACALGKGWLAGAGPPSRSPVDIVVPPKMARPILLT